MLDANAGLLNARGGNDESAAMLAVYYGKKGVLELLRGHAEIAAALRSAGATAKRRYGPDYTPLHEAAASGKTKIVALLLAHRADPNAYTDDGQTPLTMAEAKGHANVAALLRQHGGTN